MGKDQTAPASIGRAAYGADRPAAEIARARGGLDGRRMGCHGGVARPTLRDVEQANDADLGVQRLVDLVEDTSDGRRLWGKLRQRGTIEELECRLQIRTGGVLTTVLSAVQSTGGRVKAPSTAPASPTRSTTGLDRCGSWAACRPSTSALAPASSRWSLPKPGARVTGFDIAANQINAARERAEAVGLAEQCRFAVGDAERMEAGDASFDLATAGQCWHWFDKAAAMPELLRVLRPGSLLVVAHYCYLARHDGLARATEELILRLNPGWTMAGMSGLYPAHIDELISGGFELVEQFCYDHDRVFTHAGWRGRMRTCNGVGFGSLSHGEVDAFDTALAELMRQRFPAARVPVRHRVWATVVQRP